ncbi:MAG: CsbD family protein [Candidatus Angelobacter sp.]
MDKDRIQGKVEDAAGRIKRQVGEWTGDEKAQAEGLAEQAKGKAHNAIGKVKDAARDLADDARGNKADRENEAGIERDEQKKDVA